MDDFLHDAEAGRPVASEGSFWNSQDDAKLWYHYRNGDIDPHNNNREYLLQKTQQYDLSLIGLCHSTSLRSLKTERLQSVAYETRTSVVSLSLVSQVPVNIVVSG